MRIESNLCHASENKAIVQVTGWINDQNIGSALAEGPTVEDAEDRAIARLNNRINAITNKETAINNINKDNTSNSIKVELQKREQIEQVNINQEPNDWSKELAAIDSEIERLKWSREDEVNYLDKNLGYNNRNKITNYTDILKYLSLLKKIDNKNQIRVVNENINTLIEESDMILRDLTWNSNQGREYLQKEFNVSSRKDLNEKQLISFVEKLKIIRNQYQSY